MRAEAVIHQTLTNISHSHDCAICSSSLPLPGHEHFHHVFRSSDGSPQLLSAIHDRITDTPSCQHHYTIVSHYRLGFIRCYRTQLSLVGLRLMVRKGSPEQEHLGAWQDDAKSNGRCRRVPFRQVLCIHIYSCRFIPDTYLVPLRLSSSHSTPTCVLRAALQKLRWFNCSL